MVFAEMAMGAEKLTRCQPDLVSPVKVAVPRRVPEEDQMCADVGAGVGRCLVEPQSGDISVVVGTEFHAEFNSVAIVTVDQRRLHGFVQ